MLAACGALRARAETAVLDVQSIPGATEPQIQAVRSQLARASAQADFAGQACENVRFPSLTRELRAQVRAAVVDALTGFLRVGQIAAIPRLAEPNRDQPSNPAPGTTVTGAPPKSAARRRLIGRGWVWSNSAARLGLGTELSGLASAPVHEQETDRWVDRQVSRDDRSPHGLSGRHRPRISSGLN